LGHPPRWIAPGGRWEPGETAQQAAEREIYEETGQRLSIDEVPIWSQLYESLQRDGSTLQNLAYWYTLRVERCDVDRSNWTDEERQCVLDVRWWSLDELRASNEPFEPAELFTLITTAALRS